MIQNYFRIALRNLAKNRLFTGLNIVGLSLGLAACLLISFYVSHELLFDRWNPNAGRIFRPVADAKFGGDEMSFAVVGATIGPDCGRELPEVQSWCRLRYHGTFLMKREGEGQYNYKEINALYTDSTFFELFPRRIIEGDAATALSRPNHMAISRTMAEKYFSAPQLAIGQSLVVDNDSRWQVSAVFEDFPAQTHFKADFLLSMNGDEELKGASPFWGSNNNWHTYLLLHKNTDLAAFEKKFGQLSREKIGLTTQGMLGVSLQDFEKTGQFARISLQKLPEIHLHSDRSVELAANGSVQQVWIFGAIAGFILLIACINFMNLATARSASRAREVGVRKSLGSGRMDLVRQFLTESVLLTCLSVAAAVLITAALLPWFRDLTGREIEMPWFSPLFWAALVCLAAFVGLLAGSYPAFFLSAFQAVRVLKGNVAGLGKGGFFRSTLVVFQFAASVALIVATTLVYRQLNFIQNKRLGFDKSQVLILQDAYALGQNLDAFKSETLKQPGVESGTTTGFLPIPSNRSDQGFWKERNVSADNTVNMQNWRVDAGYLQTLGMELAAGRNFDAHSPADSNAVILNETAARLFGFQGDPTGQKIYSLNRQPEGEPRPEDFAELRVVGVVKDFHFSSLRENIDALCLMLGQSRYLMSFRVQAKDMKPVLAAMEKNWKSMAPGQPFAYKFLDDSFAEVYRSEQRVGTIAGIFAMLSVLISCLGLFGLAAYTTERRTKEIGIRKVLGASVAGITGLLAKDFLKLVVVAIFIASPVAYFFMKKWLADFAYRIEISWWMFALAGVLAVAIAFLTVGFQSMKAALADPVKSLRSE